MGTMNELFILMFDTLDQSATREGELQSHQLKLKKNEHHIAQLEKLEGSQAVVISHLKERVNQLEDKLRGQD